LLAAPRTDPYVRNYRIRLLPWEVMVGMVPSPHAVAMDETDIAGVSRLPRERFPTVHVVLDSVGVTSDLPLTFDITVAFPLTGQGRPPQKNARVSGVAVELNTQPSCTSAGSMHIAWSASQ